MTSKACSTVNYSRSRGNGLFLSDKHGGASKTQVAKNSAQVGVGTIPDISSRKVRERLVHLLAFKSHTKAELFSILQSEGLRNCEHTMIMIVLKDIAQLHHNEYRLRRHIWREVDVNWPYYSDKEQQQLKWFKEQCLRSPNNSDEVTSVSSCSPASTSSSSPPQHYDNKCIKEVHTLKRSNVDAVEPQPSKMKATNISAVPNNFSNYTTVKNVEQRHQYKAAFDRYYTEYIPLWQQIEELDRSFGELGGQILNVTVEHPEYDGIKKRIVEKYCRINSQEEIRRKQRCDYLHAKLTQIKRLITHFDNKRAEETF